MQKVATLLVVPVLALGCGGDNPTTPTPRASRSKRSPSPHRRAHGLLYRFQAGSIRRGLCIRKPVHGPAHTDRNRCGQLHRYAVRHRARRPRRGDGDPDSRRQLRAVREHRRPRRVLSPDAPVPETLLKPATSDPPVAVSRIGAPCAAASVIAREVGHYGARKAVQAACIRSTCPGVNMNMQESCV